MYFWRNLKRTNCLGLAFLCISYVSLPGQIAFDFNSEFSYLKGSEVSGLQEGWNQPGFDDRAWAKGNAPFWYGDGSQGTQLDDMRWNYSSFYLRGEFMAENIDSLRELTFLVDYDDGFVIWINGAEVLRRNVPAITNNNSLALENHESGFPVAFTVDSTKFDLMEGLNCIAVQVFNMALSSTDIHFNISISAKIELPEPDPSAGDVLFSHQAGFYDSPFQLTLSHADTAASIVYTLDGSNPRHSATALSGANVTTVDIDPLSTENRPLTPCVIVRASIRMPGLAPSISRTRTYIFTDKVREQADPGPPWPSTNINGQRIDLEVDPEVVEDSRYSGLFETALLDIPSMSLVSDNESFFDPYSGIYVNAENYGPDWERDCSLEMIDPEGQGFQVNAGVRIRGGASRAGWNPKHAFRLFFRKEYGDAKLEYPLFGESGADEFDKIDLRTEQNYSWSKDGPPAGDLNTFVKDIYSRSIQGMQGQAYARSAYCHLYLNGAYWGLFMTEERPEANYAESYFGDNNEDYDVIKVSTEYWPYFNEATDGNMEAWGEIWEMCKKGFVSNEDYFRLEGKDAGGNPGRSGKVLVDIDNLIDYMAMTFYTGNVDGPVSAWFREEMPNNYYAIYNRKNQGLGFIFIAHDQEHTMMVDPIYVCDGILENRVSIPEMKVAGLAQFHPQWLHHRLSANPEYRLRFADRTYRYFNNEGLFTPERAKALFSGFARIIDTAIIAESARWGDANVDPPRTRDDDWLVALEDLYQNFFPRRTAIVIDQLKDAALLPLIDAPLFQHHGKSLVSDTISFSGSLTLDILNTNGRGLICYTTNGEDPRIIGGEISPSGILSSDDIHLDISNTTLVKARIKEGNDWSAVSTVIVNSSARDYTDIKVTELHYHPKDTIIRGDTISGRDMEFLELKNTGEYAINISGILLDSAISYQVPENTFLAPGKFFVVASKPEVFYEIYGRNPSGNYKKNLSNSGEYVLLTDPEGVEILSFTYDDKWPWPLPPDGQGYSLVSRETNPAGDPSFSDYWRSSRYTGGSPFADDQLIARVLSCREADAYRVYPNPATDYFTIQAGNNEKTCLEIYDISGRPVYKNSFRGETVIRTAILGEPGLYIIKLSSNNEVSSLKIIIR